MKLKELINENGEKTGQLAFMCPGCNRHHVVNRTWQFNENFERPTIQLSVLIIYRHPKGHDDNNPAPVGYDGPYVDDICHSFVSDGKIQFLTDCTLHNLGGQTVELPDIDLEY